VLPDDRFYTKNHEWIKPGMPLGVIGVTRVVLRKIGALISVELPDPDDELKSELPFGELEGMEDTWQVYPPVEGRIVEVNEALVWNHKKLAKDPYGQGWLLKIRPHDPEAMRQLLTASGYRKFCEESLGVRSFR
jgi:glycine cleavage system H protein